MAVRLVMSRIIAAAAVILLAGCASQQGPKGSDSDLPGTRMDKPEGYPAQVTWLPDGSVYYKIVPPDVYKEHQLWRTKPGGQAEQVSPPSLEGCRLTRWNNLTALPDGRLGMARECLTQDPTKDFTDLVAYTPATGKLEVLANLGFTFIGSMTWSSSLKSGYVSKSDTVCAAIAPVTAQGVQHFPGPVEIDGQSWDLEAEFFRAASEKCTADGRAHNPVLLADGKTLLFVASPQSKGKSGNARSEAQWGLYRWVPGAGAPKAMVKNLHGAGSIRLVPGERFALMTAEVSGKQAVWAVNLQTGSLKEVLAGNVYGVAISPDGKQLAAIFQPGSVNTADDLNKRELRLLPLEGLD